MEIRPYRERDEKAVVALWQEVFAYDRPHNDPVKVIRQKLAVQPELFFVAVVDALVIGTAMAGYDGHRGWLYTVAVDPKHGRRGVGSGLVRRAEDALRALGCPKINLQLVATNGAVIAFYERLGYRVEERISMGKVLDG